jgi:hypothetical protein
MNPKSIAQTLIIAVSIFVVMVSMIFAPNNKAQAANGADFSAGNIISDAVFFNGSALTASEIQAFLNAKVPTCTINNGDPTHATGYPIHNSNIAATCLKSFHQPTPNVTAPGLCSPYPGAVSESAATIIAKVGIACNVSPKVLLVLLEKEQSLITDTWPNNRQFNSATGFACYDNNQPCVQTYAGFFYQVWAAAQQFQRYGSGAFTWYPVGNWSNIRYQAANTEAYYGVNCGTKPVFIQNRATAALYYYTPYTPNQVALSNLYGSGDACSAYGNRNFWRMFTDWFGSTKSPTPAAPIGSLDSLSAVAGKIRLSGWALDPDTTSSIQIRVDINGTSQTITADGARPDLAPHYPGLGTAHGFYGDLSTTPGTKTVCVYAADNAGGAETNLGCRTVTT